MYVGKQCMVSINPDGPWARAPSDWRYWAEEGITVLIVGAAHGKAGVSILVEAPGDECVACGLAVPVPPPPPPPLSLPPLSLSIHLFDLPLYLYDPGSGG
jgi:hypothetical protein